MSESEDQETESLESWQPPRGKGFRFITWTVLTITFLCIAAMIVAVVTRLLHP